MTQLINLHSVREPTELCAANKIFALKSYPELIFTHTNLLTFISTQLHNFRICALKQ